MRGDESIIEIEISKQSGLGLVGAKREEEMKRLRFCSYEDYYFFWLYIQIFCVSCTQKHNFAVAVLFI